MENKHDVESFIKKFSVYFTLADTWIDSEDVCSFLKISKHDLEQKIIKRDCKLK
jgi:hypothetical protein